MDEIVYVLTGTPHEDVHSPNAPFQGQVLHTYTKTRGAWNLVMRNADGSPQLGYLAREISAAEAEIWKRRLLGAQASGTEGFQDGDETWHPGNVPNSLLTHAAWVRFMEWQEARFYRIRAPKILDREMLLTAQHQQLEAFKGSYSPRGAVRTMASMGGEKEIDSSILVRIGEVFDNSTPLQEKRELFKNSLAALRAMRGESQ